MISRNIKRSKKNKHSVQVKQPILMDKALPKKYQNAKILCDTYKVCGGCQLQQLTYEGQLYLKQRYIIERFKKYGNIQPIIGMRQPYHYRNKVHAVLKRNKRGDILSGMYREKSHDVIPIQSCLIENEQARMIINTITRLIKSFKYTIYDEDLRQGFFRHILIRTGHKSGEILVVLVTTTRTFPSKKNFVHALLKAHPEITSIVQNINAQTDNMILGTRDEVLYGKGYILDELCSLTFKISPQSFYQINAVQTEKLYQRAIELAELTGSENVIDAYCGIGTIGMIASKKAKVVYGVEVNAAAIKDAEINKKLNDCENIHFYLDDAQRFMLNWAKEKRKVDVVIMDPPRAGSTEQFMRALLTLAPKKVIYISCNPETLKRDLDFMTYESNYRVQSIVPCDMFPFSSHVETITLLTKSN